MKLTKTKAMTDKTFHELHEEAAGDCVQHASNLGGLVHAFDDVIARLQRIANREFKGTDWVNTNAVTKLWLSKLVSLAGKPASEDWHPNELKVPTGIEINDAATTKLQECRDFLKSVENTGVRGQLKETLERSLQQVANLARNFNDKGLLSGDFAPLSFGFSAGSLVGGIIFHGPHDGFGSGGAPTFSVSLDNNPGWQIHT